MVAPTATLTVSVPADIEAEEHLAGCAVGAVGVAMRLRQSMLEEAFYKPGCWRVIEAASSIVDGSRSVDDDVDAVADAAGVERAEVRRWVESRTVQADRSGALQRRVMAAAERRWRAYELAEALLEVAA